jgi:hypothetical protein
MGGGDVSQPAHDSVADRDRLDHDDPVAAARFSAKTLRPRTAP